MTRKAFERFVSLPIESYPLLVVLLVFGSIFISNAAVMNGSYFHGVGYYAFFGLHYVGYGFLLVLIAAFIRVFVYLLQYTQKRIKREETKLNLRPGLDALFITVTLAFFSGLMIITLEQLFRLPPERVAEASVWVNSLDKLVFGSYVPFELQDIPLVNKLGDVFIEAYMYLVFVLSGTFGVLFFKKIELLRKFMLSFFLIVFLSAPIWYLFPAVSPHEMFVRNVTKSEISLEMQEVAVVSPKAEAFLKKIESRKSLIDEQVYADTAFPSMHIGFAVVALYYMAIAWLPSLFVLVPWLLLNMLGAVYSLQHYAIDMVLGALVAVGTIIFVECLFRFDKRPTDKVYNPYDILEDLRIRALHFLGVVHQKVGIAFRAK